MSRLKALALKPARALLGPLERVAKAKLAGLIDACLEPVRADLRAAHAKMDRILDLNLAPDVLSDFRRHNEALRAIQADCDLIRDHDPLLNSLLRDLARIEQRLDDLAWKAEARTAGRGAA